MLNDETKRKLRLMNIGEFISAVDLQEDDPQLLALPFSEQFQMAVDHVYQDKYNMKSERLIKQAKLRFPAADIHDIYYGEKRRLNRNLMGEIATCQYIEKSTSLIFQGFSSTGKTWLGCAYAKEACRHHNRTRYIRLPDLLSEFHEKKPGKGGKEKLLGKYAAYKVLVIDEWLISDLTAEDIDFLFELSELRYDSTSTIFCTLYKQEDWLMRLGGGARAESIIERYSHNVIRIEIGDENMRDIFGSRKTT